MSAAFTDMAVQSTPLVNPEQDLADICNVKYRLHMRQTMTLRLRLIRKEQIWIL